MHVDVAFISIFVLLIVVVKFLVEPKTLAIRFRDVMISPLSSLIFAMSNFFFCRLDSWDVAETFEVFDFFGFHVFSLFSCL